MTFNEEKEIEGEKVIATKEAGTDLDDFKLWLEELNGGPLTQAAEQQVSVEYADESNSGFDLLEVGAMHE